MEWVHPLSVEKMPNLPQIYLIALRLLMSFGISKIIFYNSLWYKLSSSKSCH